MKHLNYRKNKGYLYFMKSYTLILLIPFLIGIFAFIGVKDKTLSQAIRINNAMVEQLVKSVDQSIVEIKNLSDIILTNTRILKYSYATDRTGKTLYELVDIRHDLINYSISISSISDYFMYFPSSDIIMTKTSSYSPELFYNYYCYLRIRIMRAIIRIFYTESILASS